MLVRVTSNFAVKGLIAGTALTALIVGAAQNMRGSGFVDGPAFDATAVVLNDGRTLLVQTREVTLSQWQDCQQAGHCTLDLSRNIRAQDFPATGLNYLDAQEFVSWVNSVSADTWRLPTSAEWHELAVEVLPEKPDPIFTDPSLTWASTYLTKADRSGRTLRPSGTFEATSAGIEDLGGNVWEWTQDCYAGSNGQGETLASANCPAFIMGGEHVAVMSYLIRDPARGGCAVGTPPAHLGMRLVSEIS